MPTQYMRPVQQAIKQQSLPRRFANRYGLRKYQVANEVCIDVSGRRYACTSTEQSSRLRASASLHVSNCLHSDHCLQEGSEPGLNGVYNLYTPTSSLAICLSVLEHSGPSAETCFDTERHHGDGMKTLIL